MTMVSLASCLKANMILSGVAAQALELEKVRSQQQLNGVCQIF